MTNNEFIELAKVKAQECWNTLLYKHENHAKIYSIMEVYPDVPLYFDLKGVRAGVASYRYGKIFIRLNLGYVAKDGDKLLDRTVPHEIAHCFNYVLALMNNEGGWPTPHGRRWQSLMFMLGADDSRCHDYSTENIQGKRHNRPYLYKCSCGIDHWVTTRMHNSIRSGRWRVCRKCRSRIEKA